MLNSDHDNPFTSLEFADVLNAAGVRISINGRGCWMDNMFIERLWHSLKYKCVTRTHLRPAPGSCGGSVTTMPNGLIRA